MDLPCYSSPAAQDNSRKKIWDSCRKLVLPDEEIEIVKLLAPFTDDANAPNKDGDTPIHWAARRGHTEIVKILAPLANNLNVPDKSGNTLIHHAALDGHAEIVKILAPLMDNPNSPNHKGRTPIFKAA